MAAALEFLHDRCVGEKTVLILAVFEWTRKDHIRVAVVCNHDVLITTAAASGKTTRVVCVQATYVLDIDEEFTGWLLRRRDGHGRGGCCVGRQFWLWFG